MFDTTARLLRRVRRARHGRLAGPPSLADLVRTGTRGMDVASRLLLVVGADRLTEALVAAHTHDGTTTVLLRGDVPGGFVTSPESVEVVTAGTADEAIDALVARPAFDVAVEGFGSGTAGAESLRELVFFVRPGGAYVLDSPGRRPLPDGTSLLDEIGGLDALRRSAEQRRASTPARAELSRAVKLERADENHAVLRRTREYLLKLRDWRADAVLSQRYGEGWGRVLHVEPAQTFEGRGSVTAHGAGPRGHQGVRSFDVPPLKLREYRGAAVASRQMAVLGPYVLPDAFRHPYQTVLTSPQLANASRTFGRWKATVAPVRRRYLPGTYFHLDSTYPTHFGHITTEVLARVWAWDLARRHHPDVRPIVTVRTDDATMPSYERTMLAALGIDPERVVVVGPRELVEVDVLLAATPMMENPTYVSPKLADVWRRLSEGLPEAVAPVDADRLFVSRRRTGKRECIETPEIERLFHDSGFAVVYPEDHGYLEQHAMFSRARTIAGFGGSGMFNMMFAPGARVLVISGSSYRAANEELFAAANGNELHYFWGTSLVQHPRGGYSHDALQSDFHVDVDWLARELDGLLY